MLPIESFILEKLYNFQEVFVFLGDFRYKLKEIN